MPSSNYKKHTSSNPIKKYLIRRFNNKLLHHIFEENPSSILDAGCGEGFLISHLVKSYHCRPVYVLDSNKEVIDVCRQRLFSHKNISFVIGDVCKLPFSDNKFELIVCSEVLEHLLCPETALNELVRVSSKNIIISVPNEPLFQICNFLSFNHFLSLGNAPGHINHYNRHEFTTLISAFFSEIKVIDSFPWLIAFCKK